MSAGAAAVVGASLSNLVALGVTQNPISKAGVAFALASLLPALAIEWKYLILQPVAEGNAAGKTIFEVRRGLHIPSVTDAVLRHLPRRVVPVFARVFETGRASEAGDFLWSISHEARRLVKVQMVLLTASVILIAAPRIIGLFQGLDGLGS